MLLICDRNTARRGKEKMLVMKTNAANEQLVARYVTWLSELRECAPILLTDKYSNPYYTSIPEGWFDTKGPKILIVGEEGAGLWGCGKAGTMGDSENPFYSPEDFSEIQALNYNYLRSQLGLQCTSKRNNSPFWNQVRKVSEYGVCCWTNIDKIHRLSDSKCALTSKKRTLLHATPTRILSEEIDILSPTHVIFFGWYGISLRHELPDLFSKLYPNGIRDSSVWRDSKIVSINGEAYKSLFRYHPAWGNRNRWYEAEVDKALAEFFK